jgi:hypothetical protein
MRGWWLPVLLVLAAPGAKGQPADCPEAAPRDGSGLPLSIDLAGRPGVPSGVTGEVYIQVPADPSAAKSCQTERPPPRDVLGGGPGDVLRGPPSPDLLRGPGTPHVEVEALPAAQ